MHGLDFKGILEINWVRATPVSLLIFSILRSKEDADVIKDIANKWREHHGFDTHDILVLDEELILSLKKWKKYSDKDKCFSKFKK